MRSLERRLTDALLSQPDSYHTDVGILVLTRILDFLIFLALSAGAVAWYSPVGHLGKCRRSGIT